MTTDLQPWRLVVEQLASQSRKEPYEARAVPKSDTAPTDSTAFPPKKSSNVDGPLDRPGQTWKVRTTIRRPGLAKREYRLTFATTSELRHYVTTAMHLEHYLKQGSSTGTWRREVAILRYYIDSAFWTAERGNWPHRRSPLPEASWLRLPVDRVSVSFIEVFAEAELKTLRPGSVMARMRILDRAIQTARDTLEVAPRLRLSDVLHKVLRERPWFRAAT